MNNFKSSRVISYDGNRCRDYEQKLIVEEPLAINIDGVPYSVVMRTPGKEIFHVAGFCLAEGLVEHPDDFAAINFCSEDDSNIANVRLIPERQKKIADLLERKSFISQTSCGICGKAIIEDIQQNITPVKDKMKISASQALACVDQLFEHQELYKITRAAHGVLLFDSKLEIMFSAEDVGRHNALDKVIGEAFLTGKISNAKLAVLSSRISYELVQKAASARLTFLIGMSRPTTLAVELGRSLNMGLACIKQNELLVFCGKERFK